MTNFASPEVRVLREIAKAIEHASDVLESIEERLDRVADPLNAIVDFLSAFGVETRDLSTGTSSTFPEPKETDE